MVTEIEGDAETEVAQRAVDLIIFHAGDIVAVGIDRGEFMLGNEGGTEHVIEEKQARLEIEILDHRHIVDGTGRETGFAAVVEAAV